MQVQVWVWGMGRGGICLPIYPSQEVHVPKGPLRASKRASTSFLAGKFFLCFFFLDRVGELAAAAAAEEKVFWFFLYLPFFGGGVFGTAAAAGFYLALSFSLSLFRGRASLEEGLEDGREERKAV